MQTVSERKSELEAIPDMIQLIRQHYRVQNASDRGRTYRYATRDELISEILEREEQSGKIQCEAVARLPQAYMEVKSMNPWQNWMDEQNHKTPIEKMYQWNGKGEGICKDCAFCKIEVPTCHSEIRYTKIRCIHRLNQFRDKAWNEHSPACGGFKPRE